VFRRKRSTDDFAEEIQAHLELEAEELKREGLSDDEARRKARAEFGSVRVAQERFYLRSRIEWLDNLQRDLRFAVRQLLRNPGFATIAVLVLALGIGASVAIFAFVDAALLEPLPYTDPSRVMSVNQSSAESPLWPLSYPDFLDWQRMNKTLSSLDIFSGGGFLLATHSGAQPVEAARVSGGFFRTLGVNMLLGRDFAPGENRPGGPNLVIVSYGAWLHRFGGRRDVVGQAVDLDNTAYTIIGVLPRAFSFAPSGNAEFWVPINTLSLHEHSRTFYDFMGIGRLRDGVTIQTAQSEMSSIAKQLQQQYGTTNGRNLGASVIPLSEIFIGKVRPILLTLLGGAGLLLLIACVNVASLVLVRSESRRREIAVRGAIGATPMRLVRQFLTEGLLLAGFGGAAGLMVADVLMTQLARLVPKDMASNMPFLDGVGVNAHTGAFAATVATAAALLLSAIPTIRLSFQKVHNGLSGGDRGVATMLWRRLGANLVIVELAVAVVLLAGAALLGQSLYRLLHVPLGFDSTPIATVRVMASGTIYKTPEQTVELYREIVRRVSRQPGVESAGITNRLPVECDCPTDGIKIVGRPYNGERNEVDERHVDAAYLSTLKARLLRGRFFTEDDDFSRPGVAVINQTLAQRYFREQDPIGQKIADEEGGRPSVWEIVGVVEDVHEGPLDMEAKPTEYFPINQSQDHSFSLAVRTSSRDPAKMLPLLVNKLNEIDAKLGTSDEATLDQHIGGTQAALLHRFVALLVGGFAAIAFVLGVVGLYGVISYSVSQRTREIGVRMALGAQRRSVYGLVMRQAGWLTASGLAIGLMSSVGALALIRKLLFGVQAWDVVTLGCVALLLGISSLAASFLPARRAASVNPTEALRAD